MERTLRVLVLDDNPDDRLLVLRALHREMPELQVEEVNDAAGLDKALAAGGFDAVITDFQMHWTDGLTVLRQVKELSPLCPVLMFTNTGTEEVAVEAMRAGLEDYILKAPHRYLRLPASLRLALERAAARQARLEWERERETVLAREREARAAAEAASAMKDEFMAILSHELRTPLNAIIGWAALLRSGTLQGEKLDRAIESIERNARAQARLIEDLLDLSAIISGRISLRAQPLDLVPVVEGALDAVRLMAEAKSIHFETALDPDAGPVSGDPDRLQQVVWNLLSNAVKFTPAGGTVRVQLEQLDGRARILVSDTGPGIDPAFLPHVFEPFRQADASSRRAQKGLGLGLAIVRRLVGLHGGSVRADSEGAGRGAQFLVELPLRARQGFERRMPDTAAQPLQGCPPNLAGLKVLVVDDEADVRDLVTLMLEKCDAQVVAVESVAEALQVLPELRPDVLLSDLAMPGEDGYDLIRRIRALPASAGGRIPAAAITAYARAEDRRRTLLAGFNLHVAKPIDPSELLAVVASLSGRVDPGEDLP
ncbi:MAG TPA: response regulator [Thermoanaerobaculia bacterium]|nr:response regulator [Thermoanaerobaculia bacterium]